MKTYSAKPKDIVRKWYILDASQLPLGRVSTNAANLLTGKSKPIYTKHIDCGDFVIVINAKNLVVTGKKLTDKIYYRHTQYPGGIKERTLSEIMETNPSEVIEKAVYGMLPVNKLRADRMKRLKVYSGTEHPHAGQSPKLLDLKGEK